MKPFAVRLALLALICIAGPARAGDAKLEADAKHQFEEGTKFFNLGEFQSAIAAYKEGYKLVPDPVFLYNIAQAYRLSNDLSQAVFFYRGYLRASPKAANRREVEKRIAELDNQINRMKVLSSAPPNSAVPPSTLPRPSSEPPPEPLLAPVPTAPAPAPTPPPTHVEPTPAPVTTTPEPVHEPEPAPVVTTTTTTKAPERTPIYKKWWLWAAVGGVAVVGIGLGVGLGVGLSSSGAPPSSALGTLPVF